MLGANLLCAPVLDKGRRTQTAYLPRGADWVDWGAAARYDDNKDGPRGLKSSVTQPGTGATPQRGQSVKARYKLTLGENVLK